MIGQRRFILAIFFAAAILGRFARADAYDPPANYYQNATGTGATLKTQLRTIITTGDTTRSYDDLRTDLQITDADPNNPSKLRVVYNNGVSITKNTVGSIPGWDAGVTWNREHSWPQNRGVDTTSAPDGTDLFHLFSSKMTDNSTRGDLNFGGAFGAQNRGVVSDGGTKYYPGDADAGLIARAGFYVAVRYDGTESGTNDLELATGDPASGSTSTTMGDLNRLLEWHFAAPPGTAFERKRNQIIYDTYQHNRNPFIDHPEFVWSIFAKDGLGVAIPNDSQITISAPTTVNTTTGSSTKIVNLSNVIVGGTVPSAQTVTLNKAGNNGTYYSISTSGLATSSVTGQFNAFRTNQTDSKSINVGLTTNTISAGLRTGTVTIDNLDVTAGTNGGVGHAANDANDVITVNLNVLDHALPSFSSPSQALSQTIDFGNIALGSGVSPVSFDVFNLNAPSGFTAALDLDSVAPSGNTAAFTTNLAPFSNLAAGASHAFTTSFNVSAVGTFMATYTLTLSDENLSGATNKTLTLTLKGVSRLAGDFNNDGSVDAGDYVIWQRSLGQTVAAAYVGADGNGNLTIDSADYDVWRDHFGETAPGSGSSVSLTAAVPEPATVWLFVVGAAFVCHCLRRTR